MNEVSAQVMMPLLTRPYRRGAETLLIPVGADVGGWTNVEPYDFKEYKARYQADPPKPKYVLFSKKTLDTIKTTLSSGVNANTTTIAVASTSGFPSGPPFKVKIDDEIVNVTGMTSTTWSVARGQDGTIAAPHAKDTSVIYMTKNGNEPTITNNDPLKIEFESSIAGNIHTTLLTIPSNAPVGTSFAIPLPSTADATLRLQRFRQLPIALPGKGADNWGIIALLGNIAKLAWVLSWEKDQIHQYLKDVQRQRCRKFARGLSLDKLGQDLGVPRFPPREYSCDDDTLALYHLNDVVPNNGQVFDETKNFGQTGHPGINKDALSGMKGKFGKGFRFPGPIGSGAIEIPHHADFDIPANRGFIVEVFVKTDPSVSPSPRIVIVKGNLDPAGTLTAAGWSLSIGNFRGIENNVRWTARDGATPPNSFEIFANINIADGQFHHLAGTIDRESQKVRLFVDGEERPSANLGMLGAIVNGEVIRIGSSATGHQFSGVIDEVRLSKVARISFHPVLGEEDDKYRERLGIFERWFLPTPDAILGTINELVKINNTSPSFELKEEDNKIVVASRKARILPGRLQRGVCISADGNLRTSEAQAAGTAQDEPEFDPAWLVRHDDPARVDYAGKEENQKMQRGGALALNRLLTRLPSGSGRLVIHRAYEPTAADLHSVGRSLLISHPKLAPDRLAALAHAAGFDYVCHERDGKVKVSVRKTEYLEILPPPPSPPKPDLTEGDQITLSVKPTPPLDAEIRWMLLRCGPGDGEFVGKATGPTVTIKAKAAGSLVVKVELTRRRKTATGSRTLRVGIPTLAAGQAISGEGLKGISEKDASGPRSPFFHEAYLITHAAPGVAYGTNPQNRRMQRVLAQALDRLLPLLPSGGTLTVQEAYVPGAMDLRGEGRALHLTHSTLGPQNLATLAFAAGFDYIRHETGPSRLRVSVAQGELIAIAGLDEVEVGKSIPLAIEPQAQPSAVAFLSNGNRAFVAGRGNNFLTAINLSASQPTVFPTARITGSVVVGRHPAAVAALPNNQRVYVANSGDNTVTVVDNTTLTVNGTIVTGREPTALAIRPDGARLFVACASDDKMQVFDTATNLQIANIAVHMRPVALAVTPTGDEVWVANQVEETIIVFDANSNAIRGDMNLNGHPVSIAITPNGATAYVALGQERQVVPVTVASRSQGSGISLPEPPTALAITADGTKLFVTCWDPGTKKGSIRSIDIATNTLSPVVIPMHREPVALATSPSGAAYKAAVLVANRASSDIIMLDPAAIGTATSPVATTVALGSGLGERLTWSAVPLRTGLLEFSSTTQPTITATGRQPGVVAVQALYLHSGKTNPYEFEVRLVPALDKPDTTIRKDQYDIIMNILNAFHPIGVEVRTQNIREHVVEIREGLLDAFPGYTYPNFRT